MKAKYIWFVGYKDELKAKMNGFTMYVLLENNIIKTAKISFNKYRRLIEYATQSNRTIRLDNKG